MTEKSVTDIASDVVLWIDTARKAGYQNNPSWLPTKSDIIKSSLFRRISSGEEPLPFPPPTSFSYPWYDLVEKPGPYFVGQADNFGPVFSTNFIIPEGYVSINQHTYKIIQEKSSQDMLVQDFRHSSPWIFRLWFDPYWKPATKDDRLPDGGWFLQNIIFMESLDV